MTKVRQRYQLFPSSDIDDQRILGSDWPKGTPGHNQTRVIVLNIKYYLHLMIISVQKIKDIYWFFLALLLIKKSFNLIGWETQQTTLNQKVVVSGTNFPWWLSPCKKTKITWLLPQILMIKISCTQTGREAQLATLNQTK